MSNKAEIFEMAKQNEQKLLPFYYTRFSSAGVIYVINTCHV